MTTEDTTDMPTLSSELVRFQQANFGDGPFVFSKTTVPRAPLWNVDGRRDERSEVPSKAALVEKIEFTVKRK